jgi:hypothetical protein
MANSIQEQASTMVNQGQESKISARMSINQVEQMKQEAEFASSAATSRQQNFKSIADYNASGATQEIGQGNSLKTSGNIKVVSGFGQIVMGGILTAMAGIPGIGQTMLAQGLGLITKGGLEVGQGSAEINQGKEALFRAQQKLDLATDNRVLSFQEAAIAHKEANRSKIMEFKKETLEQLMDTMKPMLQNAGIQISDLSEEQLAKMMDKFFEDAGKSLANGVMEVNLSGNSKEANFLDENGNELNGVFHFIRDKETDAIYKVELAYNSDGEILEDPLGGPLLDTNKGMIELEDGDFKNYVKLKFLFQDQLELLAKELTTTSIDSKGNIELIPYNIENLEHMREFSDLINKTNQAAIKSGAITAPNKYSVDEKGEYFQKWDWKNNIPLDSKVYVSELYGTTEDMRGSIENFQLALQRSDTALNTLGFNSGGAVFKTLSSTGDTGLTPKSKAKDGKILDVTSRNSQEFSNFNSVSSVIGIVRNQNNILESSNSDYVPEGMA